MHVNCVNVKYMHCHSSLYSKVLQKNRCNGIKITNISFFSLKKGFHDIIKVDLNFIYFLRTNSLFSVASGCLWTMIILPPSQYQNNFHYTTLLITQPKLETKFTHFIIISSMASIIHFVKLLTSSDYTCQIKKVIFPYKHIQVYMQHVNKTEQSNVHMCMYLYIPDVIKLYVDMSRSSTDILRLHDIIVVKFCSSYF
jgi:hypothetical protein